MTKTLNIADIHFGSKNKDIHKSLDGLFEDYAQLESVDYIKLLGDIWHRNILFGSNDANVSMNSLLLLGQYCIKHKIKLRALEGTASHDRKQMKLFETVVNRILPQLDFLYIDTICILEENDHNCLYVPDNLSHGTQKTMEIIRELMVAKNITKIDTCSMHGAFKNTLSFGNLLYLHNEEEFLNIINGYIVSGHVHRFQVHDRVIVPGSLDMIRFGEDSVKGVVVTHEDYSNPDNNEYVFLENLRTKKYLTFNIDSTDIDLEIRKVYDEIVMLPSDSEVRFLFGDGNPLYLSSQFEESFPHVNVNMRKLDTVVCDVKRKPHQYKTIVHDAVDRTNIVELLIAKMKERNVDETEMDEAINILVRKL